MESSLLERVAKTISRYSMFAPGQRVGAAVSGGADSVCLLHVLRELAPALGISLSVMHLNHKLRGEESEADAVFVQRLAESLGVEYYARSADVRSVDPNIEQGGREARRSFFREMLEGGKVDRVATGHTLSDQAETVLI
ncbi:MAG: tRNA lysidine(34) synthetase, partial [Bryobacteraceae bacterium]